MRGLPRINAIAQGSPNNQRTIRTNVQRKAIEAHIIRVAVKTT